MRMAETTKWSKRSGAARLFGHHHILESLSGVLSEYADKLSR